MQKIRQYSTTLHRLQYHAQAGKSWATPTVRPPAVRQPVQLQTGDFFSPKVVGRFFMDLTKENPDFYLCMYISE